MKVIREYQTQDNILICLVSFVPGDDEADFDSPLIGRQITMRAAVAPPTTETSFPVAILSCLGGTEISMLDCLDEVVRFCSTLKTMYQL